MFSIYSIYSAQQVPSVVGTTFATTLPSCELILCIGSQDVDMCSTTHNNAGEAEVILLRVPRFHGFAVPTSATKFEVITLTYRFD